MGRRARDRRRPHGPARPGEGAGGFPAARHRRGGRPTRAIAEALGRAHGLPVASVDQSETLSHFGWIGAFFAMDGAATSTATRELPGWTPTGPTLLEDIATGAYGGR